MNEWIPTIKKAAERRDWWGRSSTSGSKKGSGKRSDYAKHTVFVIFVFIFCTFLPWPGVKPGRQQFLRLELTFSIFKIGLSHTIVPG